MKFKYFIRFVELQTKVISILAFFIGMLFFIYFYSDQYGINFVNFALFFISMLCIDMLTTAINHYIGIVREKDISNYDYNTLKMMDSLNLTMKSNLYIIYVLAIISIVFGVILVFNSNSSVLLLGALSFLIGVAYSYGPKPISYTPFGELFAGGAMGIILPVIVVFTQFDHIPFELNPLIITVFFPLAFLIGNILFANNLCDLEKDVNNGRFTLAYYTKIKLGITCLYLSNIAAVGFVIIAILLGFLPKYFIVMVITLIYLFANTKKFSRNLDKSIGFKLIVNNFVVFNLIYILLFILVVIFLK